MISSGINPMSIRKGLEEGSKKLIHKIEELSTPISTLEEKVKIATISAEDEELGKLVAEVIHNAGVDGIVTVEESKGAETVVEHQDGMQFDKGYLSSYFVTNPDTNEATVENPFILITDYSITDIHSIMPSFAEAGKQSNNFVIIAPEIGGNALPSLIATKMNGGANILCVGAPLFGEKQKLMLQDIAILTGGKFISKDANMRLVDIKVEDFGRADRVTSNNITTVIVGGKGNKDVVEERVESLRLQLENVSSEFEKSKIRERIAKLTSGVSVIKVGGHTEVEMKERKERVLDAVSATRAGIEGGIVAGGETVYSKISDVLGDSYGEIILKEAIRKPFDLLVSHAGLNAGEMRTELKYSKLKNAGVNVMTGEIVDLIKEGIIDPALVSINAIRNSVSVATQIITIGATIIVEEKKNAVPSLS